MEIDTQNVCSVRLRTNLRVTEHVTSGKSSACIDYI